MKKPANTDELQIRTNHDRPSAAAVTAEQFFFLSVDGAALSLKSRPADLLGPWLLPCGPA